MNEDGLYLNFVEVVGSMELISKEIADCKAGEASSLGIVNRARLKKAERMLASRHRRLCEVLRRRPEEAVALVRSHVTKLADLVEFDQDAKRLVSLLQSPKSKKRAIEICKLFARLIHISEAAN